jgi:hypothetical protein
MKEEEQTCDVNSQAQLRQSLWEFAWHHTLEALENAKFIFCCSFTEAAKPARTLSLFPWSIAWLSLMWVLKTACCWFIHLWNAHRSTLLLLN